MASKQWPFAPLHQAAKACGVSDRTLRNWMQRNAGQFARLVAPGATIGHDEALTLSDRLLSEHNGPHQASIWDDWDPFDIYEQVDLLGWSSPTREDTEQLIAA